MIDKQNELTHLDEEGKVKMVDVSGKATTVRIAKAEGFVIVGESIIKLIQSGSTPKGNVFETARLAGIMGAKKTPDLIPLCHPVQVSHVKIEFEIQADRIRIISEVKTESKTGVEMEAMTAVNIAALTIYDMLKAISKTIRFESIRLLEKSGGKSGVFLADK